MRIKLRFLTLVFSFICTQAFTSEQFPGYLRVHVSIAQVLDGYSKQFDAILVQLPNEEHFILWLCLPEDDHRTLYSVLGVQQDKDYFQPILWGGHALAIDYSDFIEDVVQLYEDDDTQSVLLQVKRQISKGTTIKINFLDPEDIVLVEQAHFMRTVERLIQQQQEIGSKSHFENSIVKIEGNLVKFCSHFRENDKHTNSRQDDL